MDRLASLFVHCGYHHQGIGRSLVEYFEKQVLDKGGKLIRVAATLYAVPFYLKMGYKKSTGVRNVRSFQGRNLPIQPMKNVL
jgi:predicted N-acetyltransferase YhbS